jgi:Ankyrin repeats (3 copies)/Ankyrin repeats (many copies)
MPTAKFSRLLCALTCVLAIAPTTMTRAANDDVQQQLLDAIDQRDPAAARRALDTGADPNKAGDFARTPLHEAAAESVEIVALLIERGAQLNPLDGDGRTPLHLAHSDSARVLLEHKADFLVLDKNGNSALHTAAEESALVCGMLIDAGLPVDARNNAGLTPLHFAALQGNLGAAQYLVSRNAALDARTLAPYSYKWTYIAWDVKGMEESVPLGSTPLSIALRGHERTKLSSGRYSSLVEFLRAQGAQPERQSPRLWWLAASPVGFLVFFYLLFHVDAFLRNWTPLASRFAATDTPTSIDSHQDGAIGRVGTILTRKMLRAAATDEGLYIAMPAWVVAAHPPLHIPWSQLRLESCSRGLAGLRIRLRVVDPAVPIYLNDGVAAQVLARFDPILNCKGES